MKKKIPYIWRIVLILLLFPHCRDGDGVPPGPEGEVRVLFRLDAPADMADDEAVTVDNITVLAFVEDNGTYRYAYRSAGGGYTNGGFVTTLKRYPVRQVFVTLFNATTEIGNSGIALQEPLATALPKLICRNTDTWETAPGGSGTARAFPLYAQSEPVLLVAQTEIDGSDLVRMLARIDIRLKEGLTGFVLENAYVGNRKTCGYIPYREADWDDTEKELTRPYVPGSREGQTTVGLHAQPYPADPVEQTIINKIYTFEAEGTDTPAEATCVIVGGRYASGGITYYRIGIPDPSDRRYAGDLIRNNIYDIVIQSVSGPGAASPAESLTGESNITATVVRWNMADQGVVIDPQYKLRLSRDKLSSAGGGAFSEELFVTTDHPAGISLGAVDYPAGGQTGWLTVTGPEGTATPQTQKITLSAGGNAAAEREATFEIRAGNMRYTFRVEQGTSPP